MKTIRFALAVFTVVVVQTSLVADVSIAGAYGDIVMLVPIAAGIQHGRDDGAIAGFVAGLALDLVVHGTPVGFFALGYTLTGYVVGMSKATVLRAAWWIPVLTALAGSALGVVVLGLLAKMLGLEGFLDLHLLTVAAVVAVLNSVLVLPMLRVVRWALPAETRGRLAAA